MITKLVKNTIDSILLEIQKEDNQKILKTYVLDTSVCYILDRLFPYLIVFGIIFILLVLLMISILVLLLNKSMVY
tara:strand:- start:3534 stop:3758 length:225 start_codon:yes stop_codon:yes gene_type:complete